MNLSTKQKEAHRLRERTQSYQEGRVGGRDRSGVGGGHVHTAVFKMGHIKDLLHSTGHSAPGRVAAWMGAEFAGERLPVRVRPKLSQHG